LSTRSRGSAAELEVQKWYEGRGWRVHRAYASVVQTKGRAFSRSHDVFGLFDLVAKKPGEPTLWVQVTIGPRLAEKLKTLRAAGDLWNICDTCLIWCRTDTKDARWKVYEFVAPTGEAVETDRILRGGVHAMIEPPLPPVGSTTAEGGHA